MNKRGFTLVELLVVIAIIGLLSTIAVVSLSGARNKAVGTKVAADLRTIQTALEAYATDNNIYPAAAATWASQQFGSYMPTVPTPPTGATYRYCSSSSAYLVIAYNVVAGVEPAGLSTVDFGGVGLNNLAAAKCGGTIVPAASANCNLDTVYCLSNTTTSTVFN